MQDCYHFLPLKKALKAFQEILPRAASRRYGKTHSEINTWSVHTKDPAMPGGMQGLSFILHQQMTFFWSPFR